jgi:tetratricopeptide (TPR) repeat protein
MVPPALVLTNRKSRAGHICALGAAWCLFMSSGCGPPGPTALLRGKRALDEGRLPEAVAQLEKAAALLPKNALAWNYLGLAYHAQQQPEQAAKAYRTALALDHKISAIRYNLGCLYLEQNQLAPAIDEFRSYSLLQPGAVDGWVRLGSALLRARRLDEAERAYRSALELSPRHPEAVNGLGLIQMHRRHWQDALNHFNVAALHDPPFPPALLNSAVVTHQYLQQRSAALLRYRKYLALQPRPADADSIEAIVRSLEAELNPSSAPAARPVSVSAAPPPTHPVTRTNSPPLPASSLASPPLAVVSRPAPPPAPSPAVTAASTSPVRTNPAPLTNLRPAPAPLSNNTSPPAIASRFVEPPRPTTTTRPQPAPAPKPPETAPPKPAELEVAQVAPDLVIKPPQDLGRSPTDSTPTVPPASLAAVTPVNDGLSTNRSATNRSKRGFLTRLNPFSSGSKSADNPDAGSQAPAASLPEPVILESGRPVTRYNYLSPSAPTSGNRTEADKDFKRGLRAQRSGNRPQAIADYQAAVRNDPAFYDAYYNLGLAAFEQGDTSLSLWAYEIALALRPDSEDARYNFALALKAGGYWLDAVEELKRIVAATPASARAHLSLANLYSQQLHQNQLAREHYERVLELNPRHAEAPKIRYWLAANP